MGFLYGELDRERQKALDAHLRDCPACSTEVDGWRSSMASLDQWTAPVKHRQHRQWVPMLKWAAAAAILLAFGFTAGRQTAASRSEVEALKSSLNEMAQVLRNENATVNADTVRLLSEYSRLQDEQRAADRQNFSLTLGAFSTRLSKMRNDLETVAFNTETGFQLADENLTRVASLSIVDKN